MTQAVIDNAENCTVNIGRQEETQISTVAKLIMGIMGINPEKVTSNGWSDWKCKKKMS